MCSKLTCLFPSISHMNCQLEMYMYKAPAQSHWPHVFFPHATLDIHVVPAGCTQKAALDFHPTRKLGCDKGAQQKKLNHTVCKSPKVSMAPSKKKQHNHRGQPKHEMRTRVGDRPTMLPRSQDATKRARGQVDHKADVLRIKRQH